MIHVYRVCEEFVVDTYNLLEALEMVEAGEVEGRKPASTLLAVRPEDMELCGLSEPNLPK